jgi:hypothetical protein
MYYGLTGVWPLLSRRSFEAVTGSKVDWWLVQTVGVLVTAIGATLTTAGAQDRVTPDLERLAAGAALGLAAVDVAHGARGRISRIYLVDAAAELALAAAWLAVARRGRRSPDAPVPSAESLEKAVRRPACGNSPGMGQRRSA